MNTPNQNKLNMYLVVRDTCQKNQTVWQNLPAFVSAYNQWLPHVSALENLRAQVTRGSGGLAKNKKKLREAMCKLAVPIAAGIKAFALSIGKNDLAETVNYSFSDLMAGRDTASADRCEAILNAGNENTDVLDPFGVTQDRLNGLDAAIETYSASINLPREKRKNAKGNQEKIAKQFRAADELLTGQMDNLVETLAESHPDFYTEYKNARQIDDAAATHNADAETPGNPPTPSANP